MITVQWKGKFEKGTEIQTLNVTFHGENLENLNAQIRQYVEVREEKQWKLTENSIVSIKVEQPKYPHN